MARSLGSSNKSLPKGARKALKGGGDGVLQLSTEPLAGSVSKVDCVASFMGGGRAKVSLYRHLSPLSVNAIMRILPVDSRVNVQPGMRCLFTPLKVGVEKPRTSFVRGDVALLASGSLICIFLQEARSDRPLNPLGKVDEGLELFDGMRPGGTVRLSLSEPHSTGQS